MAEFSTSVDIAAPPEVVYAHLVTPEGMAAWLGQHAQLDATPGGVFAVDIEGTPVRGQYLQVDPPHTVVISWGVLGNEVLPAGSSCVEFRLTRTVTGTRLDLTHTGLPASEHPSHALGWASCLPRLTHAATSRSE